MFYLYYKTDYDKDYIYRSFVGRSHEQDSEGRLDTVDNDQCGNFYNGADLTSRSNKALCKECHDNPKYIINQGYK